MKVKIYYTTFDGKHGSHELLYKAAQCYILENKLDIAASELTIVTDQKHGKPYFQEYPKLHFSISHSDDMWSCAFAEEEIGLDLQDQVERNSEKIARRFYHPKELQWLEKHGFSQFCRLWSYKESYVKYTGVGLSEGLDYFSVVPDVDSDILGAVDVCQKEISFQEGYWMVVTSAHTMDVELRKL